MQVAEELSEVIAILENVECLNDVFMMQAYQLHPLKGKRKGQYALDLGRKLGYRLIIIPLDDEEKEWRISDWNSVYKATRIVIVWEVSNHYE